MTYDDKPEKERDTEITLSNTTLLLIFLGVAIICGVFFGFGYTIGKRNAAPAVAMVTPKAAEVAPPVVAPATPAPAETPASPDAAMSDKTPAVATTAAAAPTPVAPAPVVKTTPPPAPAPAPVVKTPPPVVVKATPPPAPVPAKVVTPVTHPVVAPRPMVATKPAPMKTKQPAAAPVTTPAPVAAPSRTYVVQVAAVSHQADADVLVGALRRKGYAVNSYPGTQDNLIHVQVGPFSSQKDALAMRDKLSDDGYLAIVK